MPHIILEIPKLLADGRELKKLLKQLHQAIGSLPSVQLTDLKSRIHLMDDFLVADGTTEAGNFIHARLIQTKPRSSENQKLISQTVLSVLERFFLDKPLKNPLQICVETTLIPSGGYLKSIHTALPKDE